MEDTPTAKLRSAPQGYLELQGRGELMDGPPIIAPLSNQICTWYRYKVEEKVTRHRNGKTQTEWRVVENGVSDEVFLLRDDTGECIVDPEGAEVTTSKRLVWYGNSRAPTSAPSSTGLFSFGLGRFRYSEWRMDVGDELYAIGYFQTVGGGADIPSSAAEVRDLLIAWKKDNEALLQKFDQNKDGQIDMQEWEAVRRTAKAQVASEQKQRSMEPGLDILRRPGERRQPYLLSNIAQEDLVKRYRLYAIGSLLGFFSAGTLTAWITGIRLGL